MEYVEFALRWGHFLAGIVWIGILYYFNFVQTPFFGTELGGQAKGVMTRGLVPNALWWFRWGAAFTFFTGALIILLKWGHGTPLTSGYMTRILTGAAMGTVMAYNVWFIIWPAQKLVIANAENVAAGGEPNPAAAAAGGRAGMASRTNTLLSIPMLFFMGAASHLASITGDGSLVVYWIVTLALIGAVEANALIGPGAGTQKPLTTVSGTIHAGLGVTLVLLVVHIVAI